MEHTYFWICNVIESCNNGFHLRCTDVLISSFVIKYKNSDKGDELLLRKQDKWNQVHGILI